MSLIFIKKSLKLNWILLFTDNVIDIYQKITETKLDLTIEEEGEEEKK